MYVIVAYDVGVERVARVLKICRRYLTWVQNSLLEGELTPAQLRRLQQELERTIDRENDSVQFYILPQASVAKRVTLGLVKNQPSQVI
ncbi:CRISPR-associated endonuclease Cas2 [Thermomicrobium roseum]|jgi:CRISPR-associated protein Cas2|uniref:CRISPR-associated endoribonuclease Cas2 n=1 Tax=Thermomicrobium roseum (strain ATCC 27502 / DSM 5159 / P-2) TaxID=309801 RepID=B9L1C2_THERP|nr:CRISPR-associated endonuclease Cas2 [Thermomicrobium roseum]ACM05402.1 CRISPR-associated protein Cas2 [Thermomicrobium roseum DSM 5159]